jgi:hypothetical protein
MFARITLYDKVKHTLLTHSLLFCLAVLALGISGTEASLQKFTSETVFATAVGSKLTIITFDEYYSGTIIDQQYLSIGVDFNPFASSSWGPVNPKVTNQGGIAPISSPNTLVTVFPGAGGGGFETIFSPAVGAVGLFIGDLQDHSFGTTTFEVFNAAGISLGSFDVFNEIGGGLLKFLFFGVISNEPIAKLQVDIGDRDYVLFDNFEFGSIALPPVNQPPIANAGADQTVEGTSPSGAQVTLDGTASSDLDNDPLTFTWSATGITFDNPNSPTPKATFPLGTTEVTLTVDDGKGGSAQDTVNITVVDTTPPTITLNDANPLTLECPAEYVEPGASLNDTCDPSPALVITGSVDSNVLGTYTITYTATDKSGNIASTTRTVIVSDTTPPTITLNGANPLTLECTAEYVEPGASVSDACDPSPALVISGSVTSHVPGAYTITYTATDQSGNIASATRTVNIVDTTLTRTVVSFNGLNTAVRTCINEFGTFTIGEEVFTQFLSSGVIFSVNQFAIAYGSSTSIVGGDTGASGDPVLEVNTVELCPVNRIGNNGVLTATFVNPCLGNPVAVANVSVHVSDTEASVHVRTLDAVGNIIHDCPNVFSSCPFVVRSTSVSVDLLFPGRGIAKVEFIDEDSNKSSDGFSIDDLAFDSIGVPITPMTPTGSYVTVSPSSETTVIFSTVSFQGQTTVTTSSSGPTLLPGFQLGGAPTHYDINTTATFEGPVTIGISYDATMFNNPNAVRLLHFENDSWVDVTTFNDMANGTVYGLVSSLSPFVIAEKVNQPPIASAGADQTVEGTSPSGALVTLDGTASSDLDSDPLTFTWSATGITFDNPNSPTPTATFPLGATTVTLTVDDGKGGSAQDTVNITVQDTTPPVISSVIATPNSLWPPNHQLVTVTVSVTATDICSPTVTNQILSVTSNESDDGLGDGDMPNDIQNINWLTVDLRAERSGKGSGRIYTITVSGTDASGNTTTSTVTVTVPKSQGGKGMRELSPAATALGRNFPNPFNPETWIPYTLAQDTDVTIRIYALSGWLVRTLALGRQVAGFYFNRDRAAYWDGRNNAGEKVASGVYFYQLQAGDFSAMRRMLLLK